MLLQESHWNSAFKRALGSKKACVRLKESKVHVANITMEESLFCNVFVHGTF